MSDIRQKLQIVRDLSQEIAVSVVNDRIERTIEILTERARSLEELGEHGEARRDRQAARFIRSRPYDSHFQRCCERVAVINLAVLAERNGVRRFDATF